MVLPALNEAENITVAVPSASGRDTVRTSGAVMICSATVCVGCGRISTPTPNAAAPTTTAAAADAKAAVRQRDWLPRAEVATASVAAP